MNGRSHLITTTIFFLVLMIVFEKITITLVLAAIPLSYFPDIDNNFKQTIGHRNIITHSIILWVIIGIFNPNSIFVFIIAAVGFHCLCDIRWMKRKQTGYYTIKYTAHKGMNGYLSTIWLLGNAIISITIFIIWCLL